MSTSRPARYSREPRARLSSPRTVRPRSRSLGTRFAPMKPQAPVTRTRREMSARRLARRFADDRVQSIAVGAEDLLGLHARHPPWGLTPERPGRDLVSVAAVGVLLGDLPHLVQETFCERDRNEPEIEELAVLDEEVVLRRLVARILD